MIFVIHINITLLILFYKFEMPLWVGRLPRNVGSTSGGSLTADEYKAFVLVFLPVIVSFFKTLLFPLLIIRLQDPFNLDGMAAGRC